MKNGKYNILLVIRWPVGGIRTFCRYVYANFDKSLFAFTIIAPDIKELDFLVEVFDDFELKVIKNHCNGEVAYLSKPLTIKTILKGSFDFIHSHGLSAGVYASVPAKISHVPHMVTVHETLREEQFEGIKGKLKKTGLSFALSLADTVHHVSRDAKNNMLEFLPALKKLSSNFLVIENGVNVEIFQKSHKRDYRKELNLPGNTILIGFMGRFMPPKGFIYLIEAIEILTSMNKLPKQPIVLCLGAGGFIRENQQIIKDKGLEAHFRFLPFTPEVAASIKGFDLLAIPSVWEAFGLVAAEALVAGVPVVGTSCVGLREVLAGTPSAMVPPENSEALANAILLEMLNPTSEKALAYIPQAIDRFDVKKQSSALEKTILSMIQNNEQHKH
ncbi:MAG: glycosyltransferase family 4 protein [Thermodesulfobacteriota bacterium]|nr:glycosyltransferase family 4 protein [Thermodesulfobacteriota bacterium]